MEEYKKAQAERWAAQSHSSSSETTYQQQPQPTTDPLPNPWTSIPVSHPTLNHEATFAPSNAAQTHIQDLGYTQIIMSDEEMRTSPIRNSILMLWCPCLLGNPLGERHLRDLRESLSSFIMMITLVDIGVYIIEMVVGFSSQQGLSMLAPPLCVLSELGGLFTPEIVNHFQVWRFITSVLLHGGPLHLIMNMYVQFLSGLRCEYDWGKKQTICIYCLAGLGGGLASAVAAPTTIGIGASGAIVGLIGARMAQLVVEWNERDPTQRSQQAWQSVFFLIMLTLIGAPAAEGDALPGTSIHVNNYAHGGGLVVGILVAVATWGRDSSLCCCGASLPLYCQGAGVNDVSLSWWGHASNLQKHALLILMIYFAVLILLLCLQPQVDVRAPSCKY